MTEIEFYESLKDLLKRLDAIPGNTSELSKHYKNRGREILTWKTDLIALCSNCHAKQHDKLPSYE